MADHDVSFTIPERGLGKADIEFKVKRDGKALGRLRISEALWSGFQRISSTDTDWDG